jgi:hypothetical protein
MSLFNLPDSPPPPPPPVMLTNTATMVTTLPSAAPSAAAADAVTDNGNASGINSTELLVLVLQNGHLMEWQHHNVNKVLLVKHLLTTAVIKDN